MVGSSVTHTSTRTPILAWPHFTDEQTGTAGARLSVVPHHPCSIWHRGWCREARRGNGVSSQGHPAAAEQGGLSSSPLCLAHSPWPRMSSPASSVGPGKTWKLQEMLTRLPWIPRGRGREVGRGWRRGWLSTCSPNLLHLRTVPPPQSPQCPAPSRGLRPPP